jgi:hypothetical protein
MSYIAAGILPVRGFFGASMDSLQVEVVSGRQLVNGREVDARVLPAERRIIVSRLSDPTQFARICVLAGVQFATAPVAVAADDNIKPLGGPVRHSPFLETRDTPQNGHSPHPRRQE